MSPEQVRIFLPFIRAYAEGKTIQQLAADGVTWFNVTAMEVRPKDTYRIKPREWWLSPCAMQADCMHTNTLHAWESKEIAERRGSKSIQVREVIQ